MFTGIVESVAKVEDSKLDKDILAMTIGRPQGWELKIGQSISVDGVCLTVTEFTDSEFTAELMPETTKRSTFGEKSLPNKVNLERAMSPEGLFEGHIVQGHVDALSTILKIDQSPQWRTLRIAYEPDMGGLLVEKGSVTVSGVSLTIVEVTDKWFSVSLIPHTIDATTIGAKKEGDSVNIEYDILGKFIERQLKKTNRLGGLDG